MNAYEAKQEAKRERLERAADRAQAAADSAFRSADLREEVSDIPFGQPILVGHHSERRHRAIIAKSERSMRKGIEAAQDAARSAIDEILRRTDSDRTHAARLIASIPDHLTGELRDRIFGGDS